MRSFLRFSKMQVLKFLEKCLASCKKKTKYKRKQDVKIELFGVKCEFETTKAPKTFALNRLNETKFYINKFWRCDFIGNLPCRVLRKTKTKGEKKNKFFFHINLHYFKWKTIYYTVYTAAFIRAFIQIYFASATTKLDLFGRKCSQFHSISWPFNLS